jgi:hypothetical protein
VARRCASHEMPHRLSGQEEQTSRDRQCEAGAGRLRVRRRPRRAAHRLPQERGGAARCRRAAARAAADEAAESGRGRAQRAPIFRRAMSRNGCDRCSDVRSGATCASTPPTPPPARQTRSARRDRRAPLVRVAGARRLGKRRPANAPRARTPPRRAVPEQPSPRDPGQLHTRPHRPAGHARRAPTPIHRRNELDLRTSRPNEHQGS